MAIALDLIAPNYARAVSRWSHAMSLRKHYELLVQGCSDNSYAVIEITKSFIESVCLTLLQELGSPEKERMNLTELLVKTLAALGISNTKGASEFDKVLSTYNRLSDALKDVRNSEGQIAHGKDGFIESLTDNQKRVFVLLGDTILNLLLAAFEGVEPNLNHTREPYEFFSSYNSRIDTAVDVNAGVEQDENGMQTILLVFNVPGLVDNLELRLEPSRLLYSTDREMYVEVLSSSRQPISHEAEDDLSP